MSERAVPFHCPYCGDEDLRPSEAPAEPQRTAGRTGAAEAAGPTGPGGAAWECRSCNRAFTLAFRGLLASGLRRGDGPEGEQRS